MSRFSQLFSGHVAAAHDAHFASYVIVTEPGESAVTTKAVLHAATTETRIDESGTHTISQRRCRFVSLTTIRDDAIVNDGTLDWKIDRKLTNAAGFAEVMLTRTTRHERARDHYRK